jgi:hypothetical protein
MALLDMGQRFQHSTAYILTTKYIMGLDMYIVKRDKDAGPMSDESYNEVAYWRKFNALHGWFVEHIQDGVDDCGSYKVTKEQLFDLLEVLEEAHALKDTSKLPPTPGFFFGSYEVDEWYWDKVASARDTISGLIDGTDWENEQLYYFSSW